MKKSKYLTDEYHTSSWFEPGGWQELTLVGAAVKTGVFSALNDGPLPIGKLAKSLALDERAVGIVLAALVEIGYVRTEPAGYSLTIVAGERFGDPETPGYLGWAVAHSQRLIERWLTLPEVLKTGQPIPGDRFSETVEGFIRAMDVYAGATAEEVVELCLGRRPAARTTLDIGGATGTVSKIFADRGLLPTLFDLPEAVEVIKTETEAAYPAVTLVGGNFNESLPAGPYDIAFLGNVTHIYEPGKIIALFERTAASLNPGGLIAILDFVRVRSASAAFFGLNMLVNTTAGGTWSEQEYGEWLSRAGFADIEVIDLNARDQQLIIAANS